MVRGRTAIEAEVRVWRWMRSRSVKKIQDRDHEVELIGDDREVRFRKGSCRSQELYRSCIIRPSWCI
jgi:hypothetical protein